MGETIKCWNCLSEYQPEDAEWCSHSPATKICPYCFKCGCQAPEELKENLKTASPIPIGFKKIGEILVEAGKLSPGHLEEALKLQRLLKKKIGEILIMMSLIGEDELKLYLLNQKKIERIDLKKEKIDLSAVDKIGEELCLNYRIVPIEVEELRNGKMLRFAFYSFEQLEQLKKSPDFRDFKLIPYLAGEEDIRELLKIISDAERTKVQLFMNRESFDVLKLLNGAIFKAIFFGANQVTIVSNEGLLGINFRLVDQIIRYQTLSDEEGKIFRAIAEFFKIPLEQNSFQFQIKLGGNFENYRVYGTFNQENEQLRIFLKIVNEAELNSGLQILNLTEDEQKTIQMQFNQPGLFLLIAPPFTSYERVVYPLIVSQQPKKILSIESRIVCRLPGVMQIFYPDEEIDRQTFQKWLELDPELIFLNDFFEKDYPLEIFELSQQKKLVLVLNLFSAEQALNKLLSFYELGDDYFARYLRLIVRVREIKLLCPLCKKQVVNVKDLLNFLPIEKTRNVFEESGCNSCYFSGYFGRDLLLEVIKITPDLQLKLSAQAIAEGLILDNPDLLSMQEKALLKMQLGQISFKEFTQVY